MKTQALEDAILLQMQELAFPEPKREYRFDPNRRWRFDFAWPDIKLAVEVEGGTWIRGRHTTGIGFSGDCEKYNAAVLAGWRVLRFTGEAIRSGKAARIIAQALTHG